MLGSPAAPDDTENSTTEGKRRLTFRERSALELQRTSFEATRGSVLGSHSRLKSKSSANRPKKAQKSLLGSQSSLNSPNPAGLRTISRTAPKPSFGKPEDEWELYLKLVAEGHIRFLQLDSRTWLAERYDLEQDDRFVRLLPVPCVCTADLGTGGFS